VYVATLVDFGDLPFYTRRGGSLVSAETSDAYSDGFGWDHAAKYPCGWDPLRRAVNPSSDQTGEAAPGVRSRAGGAGDQIAGWQVGPPPSDEAYAEAMNDLARTMAGWRRLAVTVRVLIAPALCRGFRRVTIVRDAEVRS
jgi:hypothetical protein